jgi:very-short-patch-repair endonuclease
MERLGIDVMRFTNNQVLENLVGHMGYLQG